MLKKYNEILNTNDILDLLTNHLKFSLKQKGKNIFFSCPFHEDKTPSLSFEPIKKIFKCFSCNFFACNVLDFWIKHKFRNQEITSSEINQALIQISKLGYSSLIIKQERDEKKSEEKITDLFSLITNIYQHNLLTYEGREILYYLRNKRQLSFEMIDYFSLGCSINNKQLTNLLFRLNSEENNDRWSKSLLLTGLIQTNSKNQIYDYFPAFQLILPLRNEEGKIVALVARKKEIKFGENKYNYLPNYQNYQKSSLLYNYSNAKKNCIEECYLVEGFFDVISMTELGWKNCVAILGTNCSLTQIRLLQKLKKKIILFLDGDKAGKEASVNVIINLLFNEIDCESVKPNYQGDPDEICRQYNKEIIDKIIHTRQNPYLFVLEYYYDNLEIGENPQRIAYFINKIARLFSKFRQNIKHFLIEKISLLTRWKKEEIFNYFISCIFPVLHISKHLKKIIAQKEDQLIFLCGYQRRFWLILVANNYFFEEEENRKNYWNIYNYYISSPNKEFFFEKNIDISLSKNKISDPIQVIREIINIKQYAGSK